MPLSQRQLKPELMDDPQLDRLAHVRALRGLSRIFQISGVWPALRPFIANVPTQDRPLSILDVATGGGDLPRAIATWARTHHRKVEIHGCDISRTALAFARLRSIRTHAEISFFKHDVNVSLPQKYDVIICNLLLHHLDESSAVSFMGRLGEATNQLLLIDDLCRTVTGLALCYLGTRALSRSKIVHYDGPQSVRAAFSPTELAQLAKEAGLQNVQIKRHWPQRQLLIYRKPT
jgi:2-polyprenyl-3-methyl-5-hydroxy-6-metoxy-1,4-benzoquinol methylase